MTLGGWRELALNAFRKYEAGDSELLDLMAGVLEQQDRAKQILRDKGYGWTGLDIIETANIVRPAID